MDYLELNDYELVYQIRENNEMSYFSLFDKYIPLAKKVAYHYYVKCKKYGVELEDLYQEAYYGISVAINTYTDDKSLFYTYVLFCIRSKVVVYIRKFSTLKCNFLNNAISLDYALDDTGEIVLEDILSNDFSVEEKYFQNFLVKKIYAYKYDLPYLASLVYELRLNNFSNKEISVLLDIPYKKVDNTLTTIKRHLRSLLKNKDVFI